MNLYKNNVTQHTTILNSRSEDVDIESYTVFFIHVFIILTVSLYMCNFLNLIIQLFDS